MIGSEEGANDIYSVSQSTLLSRALTTLPTDGRALHVRLWTRLDTGWVYRDYRFNAAPLSPTPTPAVITLPAPGGQLTSATATFQWNAGTNVTEYWLYVGTSFGARNLYSASQGTTLSRTVSGLPVTGVPVYVRLWSRTAHGWLYRDFVYRAALNTPGGITPPF
jgi:hypothetical protein